jgi:hypothetical protein
MNKGEWEEDSSELLRAEAELLQFKEPVALVKIGDFSHQWEVVVVWKQMKRLE